MLAGATTFEVRGADAALDIGPSLFTGMAEHSLAERPVPGCPVPRIWRHRLLGVVASGALHLGVVATALAFLPAAPMLEIARGGADQAVDVMIVGEEELAAVSEGAKPQPVSLVAPGLPPEELILNELALNELIPERPVREPVSLPVEPPLVAPETPVAKVPVSKSVAPKSVTPKSVTPKSVTHRPVAPKAVALPPAPREIAPRKASRAPVVAKNPAARGQSGAGESTASRAASTRGGSAGTATTAGTAQMTSYRSRIVAHLTRFKTYPEQAQESGVTGRNAVTLTLTRDGRVASSSLSSASGQSMLDSATMAAVRRAQPFPAMPEGGPSSFTLTIGLRYDLR